MRNPQFAAAYRATVVAEGRRQAAALSLREWAAGIAEGTKENDDNGS
jgi:hypothetical protein